MLASNSAATDGVVVPVGELVLEPPTEDTLKEMLWHTLTMAPGLSPGLPLAKARAIASARV